MTLAAPRAVLDALALSLVATPVLSQEGEMVDDVGFDT
jgi:hypothetical protein